MAKMIVKGTDLHARYRQHRANGKNGLLVCLAGAAAFLLSGLLTSGIRELFMMLAVLCGLVFLGGFVYAAYHYTEASVLQSGLEGERTATEIVSQLSDSYTVFRNLTMAYEDRSAEADLVIVGPSGVYIIEVKNHNGTIRGDVEERNWTQYKVGRGGTPYQNTMYSPIKQVRTHVHLLAGILRDAGLPLYVNSGVLFANPETEVTLVGQMDRTPVFAVGADGTEELLRYLTRQSRVLSPDACQRVTALLMQL